MDRRQKSSQASAGSRSASGYGNPARRSMLHPNALPRLESRGISAGGMPFSSPSGLNRAASTGPTMSSYSSTPSYSSSPTRMNSTSPVYASHNPSASPNFANKKHNPASLPQSTSQAKPILIDDDQVERQTSRSRTDRSSGPARIRSTRSPHRSPKRKAKSRSDRKSSESRTQNGGSETTILDRSTSTSGSTSVGSASIGNTSVGNTPIGASAGVAASASAAAASRPGTAVSSNDVTDAHRDSQDLQAAARAKEVDGDYIRHMLEVCKKDQEKLQVKLNNALENPDGMQNLEQLFTVNDELVSAVNAGKEALKREKKKKQKQKVLDGPTIELLVQNEDVFSLICMLRAPTEKRLSAALALMRFAKDNDALRNEIRSSGGMHSFLTLYRGRSTNRDLRVVASLAVAYVLPSFVVKSQVTSPMTMKFLECLRFLVTSPPASPQEVNISRQEMYRAASAGVNALWTNTIGPLIALEKSKQVTRVDMATLEKQISGFRRFRARSGGGVFDQGQELKEVQDMTELAVTLIAHIAKAANQEGVQTAYGIVEQICAEDMARPIAVREGLLSTLVEWIRSKDLSQMRSSASALRYLISIEDKYNAGWIHSQVVNEGAVSEIVKLFNESVGNDVREAIAEMISALCQTPPTRAAVVESNCVIYLVSLLYEHSSPSSENMVHYAASALLQLAAGGIMQAGTSTLSKRGSSVMDKQETVLNEMIEGWAHGSFVQIALEHQGRLRSVSVEAIRVLSEDTNRGRQTRLQLCNANAAQALGKTLKDSLGGLMPLAETSGFGQEFRDPEGPLFTAVKDVHASLRALSNILEPPQKRSSSKHSQSQAINPKEMLIKGCMDLVQSEGMDPLIWISSLPLTPSALSQSSVFMPDREDLVAEACKSLANLSPLLLSDLASSSGSAKWAISVFESLDRMLDTGDEEDSNGTDQELSSDLGIDALKGIGALAEYEPLKIKIVDQTIAKLLQLKTLSGDTGDISNAANQVLLSLGFTEDEIAVQAAGNDPRLLVDWFCLHRALVIQAMARDEIRAQVADMWAAPLEDSDVQMSLSTLQRNLSDSWSAGLEDQLFENFTSDRDSMSYRETLLQQYHYVYQHELIRLENNYGIDHVIDDSKDKRSLLSSHVFPLNHTTVERDWVLSHRQRVLSNDERRFTSSPYLPERVENLLDSCFPCALLRNEIIPMQDFSPEASFDFRALMMPQRQYFSFRREGQLLARLSEKQAAVIDSVDVHWTLCFTNSTFAGEFVESLVQTLYLCPMITGLSFSKKSSLIGIGRDIDGDDEIGSGLLANLAGSLPPWVSYLTFDNTLGDKDLRSLVSILDTMGKLSLDSNIGGSTHNNQSQGKYTCMSIRNTPHISRETWGIFFNLLGKTGPSTRGPVSMPLASLKVLDLSGNKLGDEASALVLELLHEKDSGCSVEKLDLSGNKIGRGANVVRVLKSYIEYYRYDQLQGTSTRNSWKSSLHTLNLAENDLFLGQVALEIFGLLQNNALSLKYLDLSNNGLEGDPYQIIAGSLPKNTALSHLNLSGNKFSSPLIDYIFHHLTDVEIDSGLSFLQLQNNRPLLTRSQQETLDKFLRKSRKNAIERRVKGQETGHDEVAALPEFGLDEVDTGDNMITVLFSAPLVFADDENYLHPFAKLDFDMERELLWQCMKEASRDIELSFDNAHHSRLLATLTKRCSCLHYSGHGHPSNFLPFEDGMGGPNWLNVQDIEDLIVRDGVAPFKFVFVSACHSGLAGETFASAGVPHVVCCRQESELKDTAALAFTRSFYLALAVGQTVKESFEQGCKAVRATPNLKDPEKEMEKFVLLPKDGNHNVPVFRARPVPQWPKQIGTKAKNKRGSWLLSSRNQRSSIAITGGTKNSELSVRNMIQEDPAPSAPNYFLGREVDMYYVLTAILKMRKRLVSVLGEPGIGRSSLVCALCHYINERASTVTEVQHIYFIRPKHGGRNVTCRSLLRQLMDKLEESGKSAPIDQDADLETMLDAVCKSLKNDKALIVFDRTELLDQDDSEELPMILSSLLYDTKQVKILLTAKHSLGQPSIGGQVEHPHQLGPLNFENTVRLFSNLCPHLYTPSERNQLRKKLVVGNEYADCFPGDDWIDASTKSIFSLLGNGIPAKIEKAAYTISQNDLMNLQV